MGSRSAIALVKELIEKGEITGIEIALELHRNGFPLEEAQSALLTFSFMAVVRRVRDAEGKEDRILHVSPSPMSAIGRATAGLFPSNYPGFIWK